MAYTGYTYDTEDYEKNEVHYDEKGRSGTEYPIGTKYVPVNNLRDAMLIAAKHGLLLDDKLKRILRNEKLKRIIDE